jgi:hypothetical protein
LTGCDTANWGTDDLELTKEDMESAAESTDLPVSGGSVSQIRTLSIYSIDGIENTLVPLNVPVQSGKKITPEFVLDEVIENLDEKVEVKEIEIENERIYVIFDSSYAPLRDCSKEYETLILDCISNSLLDNISYVNEVVFRSDKGAYRSDNYSFGKNEVYSSN